jgi:hypothetical protein
MNKSIILLIALFFCFLAANSQIFSRETKIYGTASNWVDYDIFCPGIGIYIDVDLTSENLKKTPIVFPTITGTSNHWQIVGTTSIYRLSPTGFRIYLKDPLSTRANSCNPSSGLINTAWAKQYSIVLNYLAVTN